MAAVKGLATPQGQSLPGFNMEGFKKDLRSSHFHLGNHPADFASSSQAVLVEH